MIDTTDYCANCERLAGEIAELREQTLAEAIECIDTVMNSGSVAAGIYDAGQVALLIGAALDQARRLIDALREEA